MNEHLVDVQTNIGTVTLIQTVRKNRPKGLKRPYEYILPLRKCTELYYELSMLLRPYNKICQCAFVSKKSISRGIRLNLFVLGYVAGLCGPKDSRTGINKKEWESLCKKVQDIFFKYLGKDARIYMEDFVEKDKFQMRFETYIAYTEMNNI